MTPSTQEQGRGIDEVVYNAQIIIKAFSNGMADNKCLSQIPVAIYSQADIYENRLFEMLEAMDEPIDDDIEPEDTYTITRPKARNDYSVYEDPFGSSNSSGAVISPENPVFGITDSIRKRASNECLDCFAEPPGIDFGSLWDEMLAEIDNFLKNIWEMLKSLLPNMCNLAYLLSYVCIPDLIKLLALILAYIMKLLATLALESFSILSFIMGLLSAAISALLQFVLALFNYAMSPVACLLESLTSLADALPTQDNIEKALSAEQYKFLTGKEKRSDKDRPKSWDETPREWHKEFAKKVETGNENIREFFDGITDLIQEVSDGITSSFDDLLGLICFLDCEPKRSGTTIFEKIATVAQLIQLANLIRSVIDKKGKQFAFDKMCRVQDSPDPVRRGESNNPDPFDNNTIATVIADAFDGTAAILESDDGDIAVVFTPSSVENRESSRLSFNTCSIAEFAKESQLDSVLDRSYQFAQDLLKGQGNDPQGFVFQKPVERVRFEQVGPDSQIMYFENPKRNVGIQDIIDEIFKIKNTDRSELVKGFKLKPDVLPEQNNSLVKNETTETQAQKQKLRNSEEGLWGKSGVSIESLSKPARLRCVPIADLDKILDGL